MLPTRTSDTGTQGLDFPSRLVGTNTDDFELYEEDDSFVLTIELPGFDRDDIQVNWDEGRLFVAAERQNENRGRRRSFRMPKEIEPDEIQARYRNGVLEIRLPIISRRIRGQEIEIQ